MSESPQGAVDRTSSWELFAQVKTTIETALSKGLEDAGLVSLGGYEVLRGLGQAGGSLRSRDLLEVVSLSQPGLSRRLDRLAHEGLIERRPDPDDGRGVIVKISRSGRAALRSAAKVHAAVIGRDFSDRLTDRDAAQLNCILRRLVEEKQ